MTTTLDFLAEVTDGWWTGSAITSFIRTIEPNNGPNTGGTTVTIIGENMGSSAGSVTLGGIPITIVSWTSTQIVGTTGVYTGSGTVDVVLTTSGGTIDTYENAFTYNEAGSATNTGPLNRAIGRRCTGTYTRTTGPNGLSWTAFNILTQWNIGNASLATGTLTFFSTTESNPVGITCTTFDSFIQGSTTWYMRYYKGAMAANIKFNSGIVVTEVRLYNSTISATSMTHYFKDFEENSGKRYLP